MSHNQQGIPGTEVRIETLLDAYFNISETPLTHYVLLALQLDDHRLNACNDI